MDGRRDGHADGTDDPERAEVAELLSRWLTRFNPPLVTYTGLGLAQAMRHSTALRGSATYDKERAERSWAAAVSRAEGDHL